MARSRMYRRRTKRGGLSKPFSRSIKKSGLRSKRSRLAGGARRKQRVRRLKKRGGQLRAGQKFNARGQIVKDRNKRRVKTRTQKQAGKSPKRLRGRTRKRRARKRAR